MLPLVTIFVVLWLLSKVSDQAENLVLAPVRMAQGVGVSVELANLRKAAVAFQVQRGRYPLVEEMGPLVDQTFQAKGRDPKYDMWGTPYYYELRPRGFELRSAGPDKILHTGDDLALEWSEEK